MLIVSDYRKFVITSLTKIKYDLSDLTALSHTVNASNMILESGGLLIFSNLPNTFQEAFILDEIFPIKSINDFEDLEQKIDFEYFDKQLVYNWFITLLVGSKSVGDSVRRLKAKMFEDKVLLEFSLKKSF